MPSVNKEQEDLMRAVAHDPKLAAKTYVPQKVSREIMKEDPMPRPEPERSKRKKRYGAE